MIDKENGESQRSCQEHAIFYPKTRQNLILLEIRHAQYICTIWVIWVILRDFFFFVSVDIIHISFFF